MSEGSAPDRQPIVVRQMDFDFPDEIDPILIVGNPEESYGLIGLSLLLPFLEPYLIRTMTEAKKQITDPQLRDDLERFSMQEGQHYRQHIRFNQALDLARFRELPALEKALEADYRRFTAKKSPRFNLAYAEGFEALTTAVARFWLERGFQPETHPAAAQLFRWHLVEELEHRTVAFDVYDHIYGDYFYRLVAGCYAQWHMSSFIRSVARHMTKADPEAIERSGGKTGRRARSRQAWPEARSGLLPKLLQTYSPRYTPHAIPFEAQLQELASEMTRLARSTR